MLARTNRRVAGDVDDDEGDDRQDQVLRRCRAIASIGLLPEVDPVRVAAERRRDAGVGHPAGRQDVQARPAEDEDQHDPEPERGHGEAHVREDRRRLVEQRIAFDRRRRRPIRIAMRDPDDERDAGQDERRQGGRGRSGRRPLSPRRDREAEVAVEDAVRRAADRAPAGSSASRWARSGRWRWNEPAIVSSTSGLQKPIQRQYWTGIGWSRPQAFLNASCCCLGHPGVVGELRRGPARARRAGSRRRRS